jgi:DNA (cytosine-5)-methyltransferase 1
VNYYNENDARAANWLENLISAGVIPAGHVDRRDIRDVRPRDLDGYSQHHFFAGIGGWPLALQFAGWPAGRPVWTASCPCQPFSDAGRQLGTADERHLWPVVHALARECRPATVFGEQVASKLGRAWLASVRTDLENLGYAVGAADLCAPGVGAPHIRQRLYWVAHADDDGRGKLPQRDGEPLGRGASGQSRTDVDGRGDVCRLANANGGNCGTERKQRSGEHGQQSQDGNFGGGLVHPDDARPQKWGVGRDGRNERVTRAPGVARPWADVEWLPCSDGKYRPVEPGTFPLAQGVPGRVGRLRGYGNAIVPQLAAEFIKASVESLEELGT